MTTAKTTTTVAYVLTCDRLKCRRRQTTLPVQIFSLRLSNSDCVATKANTPTNTHTSNVFSTRSGRRQPTAKVLVSHCICSYFVASKCNGHSIAFDGVKCTFRFEVHMCAASLRHCICSKSTYVWFPLSLLVTR